MKHYTFNEMLARDAYYGFMDDDDDTVGDELEVTLKVYGCETEKESDWV